MWQYEIAVFHSFLALSFAQRAEPFMSTVSSKLSPRTSKLAVEAVCFCALLVGAWAAPAAAKTPLPPSEVLHKLSPQDSYAGCGLVGAVPGSVSGSTYRRGANPGGLWAWREGEGYRELFTFTSDHGQVQVAPARADTGDLLIPLAKFTTSTLPAHLQFFRWQANGSGAVIGRSSDNTSQPSPLAQGSDRRLYGIAEATVGSTTGRVIYAFGLEGDYEVVYRFAAPGLTWPSGCGLTLGPDGALYGVAGAGGQNNTGGLYRLDSTGQFSIVHHFAATEGSSLYRSSPALGADATFYGVLGRQIYAIQSDGSNFRVLKEFRNHLSPRSVQMGSDGRLYIGLTAQSPTGPGSRFHVYAMTSEGQVRSLYRSPKAGNGFATLVGDEVFILQNFGPTSDFGGSLTRITLP